MTNTEYNRTRLDALPAAFQLVSDARQTEWKNTTGPIWQKLFRVGEAINKQLAAEIAAYFAEEERETPAPAVLKSSILKASAEAQGIPVTDLPAYPFGETAEEVLGRPPIQRDRHLCPGCKTMLEDAVSVDACPTCYPGLDSLLGAVRTEARATLAANGFSPADYPTAALLDEIHEVYETKYGHAHRCPACRRLFNCQCNGPAKSDPYALCAPCQNARRS